MQKTNPMPKSDEFSASEARIQQQIVRHYRNTYCLKHHNQRCMMFSVPNESNGDKAMKLIQTGLYHGCADLVIFHVKPSGPYRYEETIPIFVEVKTETGKQSDNQKEFEAHCKQIGVPYFVVRSLEDFQAVISSL